MKRTFIIAAFLLMAGIVSAQQNFTLFYMNRVMQSKWVNPVSENTYSVTIGGLIVPLFGQVPPAMHFNYANNAWMYNDIFHKGTGNKADSLVFDLDRMMDNVHKKNHFRFENDIELFSLGINWETMYLSLSLNEKIHYGVTLPGDLIHLMAYGNRPYFDMNKPIDLSGFNLNFLHYHEFAIGLSAVANDKIRLGGRMKLLFGLANISTSINNFSLYTNPDNVYMTGVTDMTIHASQPIPVEYIYYEDGDSVDFNIPENAGDYFQPLSYFANPRNFGFAFDLGASYEINRQWSVFASATDIGLITWNTNPFNLVSQGSFLFKGMQVQFWNDSLTLEQSAEELVDSVLNTFHFESNNYSYVTMLPSNIYIGGMYKFKNKLHFGALYRAELYKKSLLSSVTLSVNSDLTRWFSAHLSYTIANNNFANIGLGISLRAAIFQYYIVTDNLIGWIWPQKSQNFNIRMGCNLVFGYKQRPESKIYY
ncbi:MAG TPA: DUF5723 family protein [Bacteroidales bacterium]|nr:hypothetical protein [Bacteroidales bacterium]HOE04296.1 DUF5723 family protein [Bacteroidales bacterium]HQL69646.1 DUF5723 family protein [Bacteroidales bacterium]